MRYALVIALLMVPAAAAQVPFTPGDIEVERARHNPVLFPLDSGILKLDVLYACRDYDGAMEDLRLAIEANATTRSGITVPVDVASHRTIPLENCRYNEEYVHVEVDVTFTLPDFTASDILDIRVVLWTEADEALIHRGSGDPLQLSKSIPMHVHPEAEERRDEMVHMRVEAEDDVQYAPGAPLPLVAGGLAALAFLRRRL